MMQADQPQIIDGIAINLQLLNEDERVPNIPIIQIKANLIPGRVDVPEVIFNLAFVRSYALAAHVLHKQPHPEEDTVQIVIQHDEIYANNHYWGTPNMICANAIPELIARWEESMQSGGEVDLSNGGLEMIFTFTFLDGAPIAQPNQFRLVGMRGVQTEKSGLYKRAIFSSFFTEEDSLLKIPFTEENLCWPMAFMMCRCRELTIDYENQQVTGIQESFGKPYFRTREDMEEKPFVTLPISDVTVYRFIYRYAPRLIFYPRYLNRMTESDQYLILFNCFKTKSQNQKYVYEEIESPNQLTAWKKAASCLHQYVERMSNRSIDHTNFYECGQFYANCFQVFIHILRVETMLQQTHFFQPVDEQGEVLLLPKMKHIYLLFGDERGNYNHCHAVTNIRSFFKNYWVQKSVRLCIRQFCDFCQHNFYSKKMKDGHVDRCLRSYLYQTRSSVYHCEKINLSSHHEDLWNHAQPKCPHYQFFYHKKKSEQFGMKVFQCQICYDECFEEERKHHVCTIPLPKESVEEKGMQKQMTAQRQEEETLEEENDDDELEEEEEEGEDTLEVEEQENNRRGRWKEERPFDENYRNLFVYDIESRQEKVLGVENGIKYIHVPNCICLRHVYDETYRQTFRTIADFCTEVFSNPRFHDSILFAHNGGSYDIQFIIRYCEINCIPYTTIPRPGSIHKYLSFQIKTSSSKCIEFKDFLMFFPASLKNIAESLQCSVQKGDFPHRFNVLQNEEYVGPIPPMDTDEDYYCLQTKKSTKEIDELKEWYQESLITYCSCSLSTVPTFRTQMTHCPTCHRSFWNFQTEIIKYCFLDVDVLAECIKKFRQIHLDFSKDQIPGSSEWQPCPIECFDYLTQPSVALQIFLRGHRFTEMRPYISKPFTRHGRSKKGILWLEKMMEETGHYIQHAGNSLKEYFEWKATRTYVDGYAFFRGQHHIYEFFGCFWHGCSKCFPEEIRDPMRRHPRRNLSWNLIHRKTYEKIDALQTVYGNQFHYIWECEYDEQRKHHPLTTYEKEIGNIIEEREFFFGGRTEVFSPYAKSTEMNTIEHHDVTSMYPYICAQKYLPFGQPTIYFGRHHCKIERLSRVHSNPYFGFVRCRVIPNPYCKLGLLPNRNPSTNRLEFNLFPQVGTWFTEELYLAMENGYQVVEIYQIIHFAHAERSNTYFRGYMSYFLRQKQEAEGWKKAGASSEQPTEEEKNQVIEQLYRENGNMAKMRKEKVRINPESRALAKLLLNCLWGKFCQWPSYDNSKIVFNFHQWIEEIIQNVTVDQSSLKYRKLPGAAFRCYYNSHKEYVQIRNNANIYIAAAITSYARCILHQRMLAIGPERILYCDTDSVIALFSNEDRTVWCQRGLGNWTNETERGNKILSFYGLAPKCYMKCELNHPTGIMKCKGIRMTVTNSEVLTVDKIRTLLENTLLYPSENEYITDQEIYVNHMTIASNSTNQKFDYAEMFTTYGKKKVQVVLSKRRMVPFLSIHELHERIPLEQIERIYLLPHGPLPIHEHPDYQQVYNYLLPKDNTVV